jgi:hypothetical protein
MIPPELGGFATHRQAAFGPRIHPRGLHGLDAGAGREPTRRGLRSSQLRETRLTGCTGNLGRHPIRTVWKGSSIPVEVHLNCYECGAGRIRIRPIRHCSIRIGSHPVVRPEPFQKSGNCCRSSFVTRLCQPRRALREQPSSFPAAYLEARDYRSMTVTRVHNLTPEDEREYLARAGVL